MKIVLAPIGTRGDVQPLLALGVRLTKQGHRVVMCAPVNYRDWIEGFGLDFTAAGEDFQSNLKDYRDGGTAVVRSIARQLPTQFEALESVSSDADAIVGAGFQFAGPSVAELLRIPYFYAIYWPQLIPSSIHPILGMPWLTLPSSVNRLLYAMWPMVWNLYFKQAINQERAARSLVPIKNVHRYLAFSGHALLAFDPEIGRVPPERAFPCSVTGSFHLTESNVLEPELEAFLAEGPAPVYMGFGSMPTKEPMQIAELLAEAALTSGHRALISSGWGGLNVPSVSAQVRVIGPTAHLLLFPRVAAVVHHGGAGTTAAAARAGVPQIIVPHFGDQFYWAYHVHRCRLGPPPIRRGKLNVDRLVTAIQVATTDVEMKGRALAIGNQLRASDGVGSAIGVIEAAVKSRRGSISTVP